MGKNKYIESPEKFWELFQGYKKETKANPFYLVEQRRGQVNIKAFKGVDLDSLADEIADATNPVVELPVQKPLTMVGFECYCMEHTKITYPDLTDYFEGKIKSYEDYLPISTRIRKEIEQDQLTLGLCNLINPSLTARINGYVDKRETEHKGGLNIPNLPDIGNR